MEKIDDAILSALDKVEGDRVPVLITGVSDCATVSEALERKGIAVTQSISEINVIGAAVSREELQILQDMPEIESVELDAVATIS